MRPNKYGGSRVTRSATWTLKGGCDGELLGGIDMVVTLAHETARADEVSHLDSVYRPSVHGAMESLWRFTRR